MKERRQENGDGDDGDDEDNHNDADEQHTCTSGQACHSKLNFILIGLLTSIDYIVIVVQIVGIKIYCYWPDFYFIDLFVKFFNLELL